MRETRKFKPMRAACVVTYATSVTYTTFGDVNSWVLWSMIPHQVLCLVGWASARRRIAELERLRKRSLRPVVPLPRSIGRFWSRKRGRVEVEWNAPLLILDGAERAWTETMYDRTKW